MARRLDGQPLPELSDLDVLVYGSCVARDLVTLHEPSMHCVDYIARQSWISAGNLGSDIQLEQLLASKFQQRNLEGDLRSDALERVDTHLADTDLLLIDLIDERFGVYRFENGYVTPSAEFKRSGLAKQIELGKHIPFGSDEHLRLWHAAAEKVRDLLAKSDTRTYVLETPYTSVSVDGSDVAPAMGRQPEEWNRQYQPYFGILRHLGFTVLKMPVEFAVTTPHHIWGSAPFHYVEQSYRRLNEQIGAAYLRGDGLIGHAGSSDVALPSTCRT